MFSSILNFIFYHTPFFYLIQSVWRDEAFSYFMAKPDIIKVIINTAHDFNPPFYYLLLHFWMRVVGHEDSLLRILSFLPHMGSVYVAYLFGEKLLNKRFAAFLAVFTLFNPMLLYYAFEMRMYSYYAFFTFCSFYFFYRKNWGWYTVFTVLGLFTHSFFSFIPFSFLIYLKLIKKLNKKSLFLVGKPFLFYLPWLPILAIQFIHSKNSWLFPVDWHLIKSVLGNLFTNFEGTPGNWWGGTFYLSIFILVFLYWAAKRRKKEALPILTAIFIPLFLVLGYSVLRRPLYVNRYMIFITVFEIIGISLGIAGIKNAIYRAFIASFWLILVIGINLWIAPYHKKTDFKTAFAEINKISTADDLVYTKTPIGFLESAYYYKYPNRVYVFNPQNISIPDYIGVNVVFPHTSKYTFSANRTFLISDDASYSVVISQ